MQKIINLRFDNFDQWAAIQYVNNLEGAHFWDYANYLIGSLKMEPALQGEFREYFSVTQFAKEQVWTMFRTMFSIDQGGNDKYVCIMTIRHPGNKYSFLVADMKA